MQYNVSQAPKSAPRKGMAARLLLVLCVVAAGAGLAWAIVVHNQQAAQAAPTFLATSLPGFEPWGLTQDHAGNIWVADPQCDPPDITHHPFCATTVRGDLIEYASIDFNKSARPLSINQEPAGYSSPFFVAADSNNNIWFTEPVTNALGELDSQGNWRQWSLPTPGANPFDLTIDQYGHIWFTEPGISAIGEFDPTSHQFHSLPTPSANGDPYGISGPDPSTGSIWFTENNPQIHRIGRLTPTSSGGINRGMQEYLAPASNRNTPHLITFDTKGNIWWSEGWAGNIGQLAINQALNGTSNGVREYSVPSPNCPARSNCGIHISGIGADSNGVIWFDDSLSSQVGSYTPGSGFSMYTLEGSVSSGSHPHDGLIVDHSRNIWLSEEFGNRLVEGVQQQPLVYNNTGISDNSSPRSANFDGHGYSYSAQALQTKGIAPNSRIRFNGYTFTWPNVSTATPDNYQAAGQGIPVASPHGATFLGLLGSATNGAASGTVILTYTDGTRQSATLGFTDWAVSHPSFSNQIVATFPYRNGSRGQQTITMYLFLAQIPLLAGKSLSSITMPSSVHGGQLHLFALGTK